MAKKRTMNDLVHFKMWTELWTSSCTKGNFPQHCWTPSNPQFTMTDLNVNQLSNQNSIDLQDYNVQLPGSHKGSPTAQGEWPVLQTEHSELHSHPRRNGLMPVSTLHHDTLHYLHPANYILAESGMPAEERKRLSI